jgi:hypothetical protein
MVGQRNCPFFLAMGRMRSIDLILLIAILTEARKQKSWLSPNMFLSHAPVRNYSGLLTESNGKVYSFGGLSGSGG